MAGKGMGLGDRAAFSNPVPASRLIMMSLGRLQQELYHQGFPFKWEALSL